MRVLAPVSPAGLFVLMLWAAAAMVGTEARAQRPESTAWPLATYEPARLTSGATGIVAAGVLPSVTQFVEGRVWQGAVLGLVEVGSLWVYLDARADRQRERLAYRDLAWSVARGEIEPRVDPGFEYYEDLIHWTRSGGFDIDPVSAGVQPERDPTTFNGRQWELAAEIFLGGDVEAQPGESGYGAALEYYQSRAWSEDLAWDWGGETREQERFASLIDDADAAARRASVAVGVVVANHFLSAIEAFVAHRLGALPLQVRVAPDPLTRSPQLRLTLPWSP